MAESDGWDSEVWSLLNERERDILARRHSGQSLSTIGAVHRVTRERARQILLKADQECAQLADMFGGSWRERVHGRLKSRPAVPDAELADEIGDFRGGVLRSSLLRAMGLTHPSSWAGELVELWTSNKEALGELIQKLLAQAPYHPGELEELALALGIPGGSPLEQILTHSRSPLVRSQDGAWLRRNARHRDAAYLWLSKQGEPRRVEDIRGAIRAKSDAAVREGLRRDERFILLRAERVWALVEWPLPQGSHHANALDAVIEVVTEHGPITRKALFAEVTQRYPVSPARLSQCLISSQLGRTPEDLIDLSERGAKPMEEKEPRRPGNMAVDPSGHVIGVRLSVDKEILRGSGLIVHSWLTWRLGLRLAPMTKTFTFDDGVGELRVSRNTSAAQLSSMRQRVLSLGMGFGCHFVTLLRLDASTVSIRHVCEEWACPAATPVD
ncbi:sigma factor-like helix-turn-helix DNA-binding protein [Streptomyces sp. NPDC017940]|uniref:sigma factor-like helix-turn-helix DNA-binding protein n=1 Tax=Streptomyces sp. NPDC017940 TaxID=3365017 RepID=UPI00379ACC94